MLEQIKFESLVATARQDTALERTFQDVRAKYGPMLTQQGISTLDPSKFRAFLTYNENRHWTGINRHSGDLTADLPRLKNALWTLLDKSKPIASRIGEARKTMDGAGLGRAVISAILTVAYPEEYGVYNRKSELGLQKIGMFPGDTNPEFSGQSTGKRYEQFNEVLSELRTKYNISFWALDWVLGDLGTRGDSESAGAVPVETPPAADATSDITPGPGGRFALEKHLEEFLVESWDQTPLSAFLEILDEDGEAKGNQYPTDVGLIDILCKNKDGSGFTVVELKRDQTSDQTVGQVARYMGWVRKHLARGGEAVNGLIICRDADEKLMTALAVFPNVAVFTYQIRFTVSKKE